MMPSTATLPPAEPASRPAPAGTLRRHRLDQRQGARYYLYRPQQLRHPGSLFIAIHGISRNAREHAERFAPFAEQHGIVMLVPLFDRQRGAGYQRLDEQGCDEPADQLLLRMIDDADRRLRRRSERLYLFGFSGGAQFAHRFMFRHPERIQSMVLAAAGWYTFPDPRRNYPRGLRATPRQGFCASYPAFLDIPTLVLVGDQDNQRDPALNARERIDRQQGRNRIERGQQWVEAMNRTARSALRLGDFRFEPLPGVGHNFGQAMDQGLGQRVFTQLFGPAAAQPWHRHARDEPRPLGRESARATGACG